MEVLQGLALILSILAVGLMAGVFAIYANGIMPGLRATEDRTFVAAFQAMDRAIVNPRFLSAFVAALLATGLSAVLLLGETRVLPWVLAAFVLYLAVFVVTIRVNVPLNDALKAAGTVDDPGEAAAVRARFDEALWVRWNVFRAVATTAALGCLAWALVEFGRGL
jgi:uncharacterized membrane protein